MVGKIVHVYPNSKELLCMRKLLNVVKGARSFEEIQTVRWIVHPTYRSACNALGLLGDDREWHDALNKAGQWATSFELR